MIRIYSLDILRGLAAFSIMIFHYAHSVLPYELDASHPLSRLGYYSVSIFYILSGLTLSIVYKSKISTANDTYRFYLKRVLRIYPLMIVCVVLSLVTSKDISLYDVMINVSGLFGFFDFDNYISTGSWSIGNELVFYIFFPIIIFLKEVKPSLLHYAFGLSFIFLCLFSFEILNEDSSTNWTNYINPLNQIFYFICGVELSGVKIKINTITKIIGLLASILILLFYPAIGNDEFLIIGINRLIFSSACILVVYFSFLFSFNVNGFFIATPLLILGEISYGVYLLHPIVWTYISIITQHIGFTLSLIYKIPLSIIITLGIAYISYNYFEIKVMKSKLVN